MTMSTVKVYSVLDENTFEVPYTETTTAEDVCITLCKDKKLGVGPASRHLFALRITGKNIFLMPSATFDENNCTFDLRIRFKVAKLDSLKKLDQNAYNYYFHQARCDVLENKIPDLSYEKYKRELVGLGIADMYRVMLEKDIPREVVEVQYKRYIPKEVIKRHAFFIKKPIHDHLGKIQKTGHDPWYVKATYLKQLDNMAPEYLAEEYKAMTDQDGVTHSITIRVSPYHPTCPGVKYCFDSKKDEWFSICTIEELSFISIRKDCTVEISRKNGIPFYAKFNSEMAMYSFVSLLDGYYRLTCKWTFNICRDVITPSLQRLYLIKCHGPVGGEFSYAKLEEKRDSQPGCYILRESEFEYNTYYIDVCTRESSKPKTIKLLWSTGGEIIFNEDPHKYNSIQHLVNTYSDPKGEIYLHECLPPSEYDKSQLLLCQTSNLGSDLLADGSALNDVISSAPLCINSKDLQVYKSKSSFHFIFFNLKYVYG